MAPQLPPWMVEEIEKSRREEVQIPLHLPIEEPPPPTPAEEPEVPDSRGVIILDVLGGYEII